MHKAVEEIHYGYNVETCQCMLRNAEKVGFKYLILINPNVARGCDGTKRVNSNEYDESPLVLCEKFFAHCRANRIVLFKRLL